MATASHANLDASDLLYDLSLDPKTKASAPDSENKAFVEATKVGSKDEGSNPKKLGYQNTKSGYGKGAYSYGFYPQAYQYPRYGYSGSYASGKTSNLPYLHGRSGHSYGYMDNIYADYGMYGPYMNGGYGYGCYGYDAWKHMPNWYAVNSHCKTATHGYGYGYGKENIEGLNELNRGPRAKGFKSQETSKVLLPSSTEQIVTETEKPSKDYNQEDFPEIYSEAKFFVIKSYSEDDIHKSIKYSVWSSTPNGNKKLDASYKQKSDGCPVFLLFSVNTSGQFVGLAEMVGPVDFNKTVEYWQQDKWIGCFPVKWHIVKDIPNSSLRHITLENNENKPVTNSRDTQEVKLEQGIKVIKIFKDHASKTCILDDFVFYETRQKIIQEGKSKHLKFKKQALVANNNVSKDSLVTTQESTAVSKDAMALGGVTEVARESKVVSEKESDVFKNGVNGVATAC